MLIGKTTSDAAETYSRELKIPWHLINRNASESFQANRRYQYSNWLLARDDRYWDCLYFPSSYELAALANSPDEKAARNRILQSFPNNLNGLLHGTGEFAYQLNKAFASNTPLSLIGQKNETEKTAA